MWREIFIGIVNESIGIDSGKDCGNNIWVMNFFMGFFNWFFNDGYELYEYVEFIVVIDCKEIYWLLVFNNDVMILMRRVCVFGLVIEDSNV